MWAEQVDERLKHKRSPALDTVVSMFSATFCTMLAHVPVLPWHVLLKDKTKAESSGYHELFALQIPGVKMKTVRVWLVKSTSLLWEQAWLGLNDGNSSNKIFRITNAKEDEYNHYCLLH